MIEISDSTRWRHRIGVQLAAGFFASLLVGCVEPTARALPDPKKTRTEADLNRDLENSLAAVIQREGQAKADAMMRDSVPDSQKQAEGAAAFWSFYLRNTRSRVEFCQTHSVDVSTFVRKFTAAHVSEHAAATRIFEREGLDSELFWRDGVASMAYSMTALEIETVADLFDLSVSDSCRLYNEGAEDAVIDGHFSIFLPSMHQALMSSG